jgi:hypothetical protein
VEDPPILPAPPADRAALALLAEVVDTARPFSTLTPAKNPAAATSAIASRAVTMGIRRRGRGGGAVSSTA